MKKTAGSMIRIILVDDEPTVRRGLKMRLELTKDLCVVGEAGDGDTALRLIRELIPDVVVMDIELPQHDGIAVTQTLGAEKVSSAVVILSMYDDAETRARARAAGAAMFVSKHEGAAALLQAIRQVALRPKVTSGNPARTMRDFYTDYYAAVEPSRAHAAFCAHAYGKNLCQHGFTTIEQLTQLIDMTGLNAQSRVLDLGCGNGMIAEYISDVTGAHVGGLDYIPAAIARAEARTAAKRDRLEFVTGDLTRPQFPPDSFDTLLSMDTLYFSDDYAETLRRWRTLLKSGGQMAIFLSHGANPQTPKEIFDRATLPPDKTPLADALKADGLDFQTWDLTRQDHELAQRKKEILEKLKAEFQSEGNQFLYENRIGETLGVLDAIESGMHARYLYLVRV